MASRRRESTFPPAAFIDLVQAFLAGESRFSWSAIPSFLESLSGAELVVLAQRLRNDPWCLGHAWGMLDPGRAGEILSASRGPALAALLSMHRNGRVRAAALQALLESKEPLAIKALLLRTDDIVDSIRDDAVLGVCGRMTPDHADAFVAMAPAVEALSRRARAARGNALGGLGAFLRAPGCREALERGTVSPDARVRRAAFRWLLESNLDDATLLEWLRRALADPSVNVVRWAAVVLCSTRLAAPLQARLLPLLEAHRAPEFRRRAVQARARAGDRGAVRAALLDPSEQVRFAARSRLRSLGMLVDLRQECLAALAGHPSASARLGALAGLGEVGVGEQDLPIVRALARSPGSAIRAEATRALAMLGASDDELRLATLDPCGRVRREARKGLERRGVMPGT